MTSSCLVATKALPPQSAVTMTDMAGGNMILSQILVKFSRPVAKNKTMAQHYRACQVGAAGGGSYARRCGARKSHPLSDFEQTRRRLGRRCRAVAEVQPRIGIAAVGTDGPGILGGEGRCDP